jgi:N6-adenosine-specific RNA methylase IME4
MTTDPLDAWSVLRLDEPAPTVGYRTIVADPPWSYRDDDRTSPGRRSPNTAARHYPTQTREWIASLPIGELAADDAHLYLWVTCPLLFEVAPAELARGWGFEYKTAVTWIKTGGLGLGHYYRVNTEHALLCVRGAATVPPALRERNHFAAPRTQHSRKPDAFFDLVERVSPGPYVELFSRRARLGWDYWGDEVNSTVELEAA